MSRTGRATPKQAHGDYPGDALHLHWHQLHRGDREPYPDVRRVTQLAKRHPRFATWVDTQHGVEHVATAMQESWRAFHGGDFVRAIKLGSQLDGIGAIPANKAAAIHVSGMPQNAAATRILAAAIQRGEHAVELLPDCANAHYMLALALGRYSQRTSVITALAEGVGTRVRTLLERTLRLDSLHAEAHIAFGLYHAEIVGKLGSLIAGLTYGATASEAIRHFRRALDLVPESPIAHIEYACGLLLLDADAHRAEARRHYEQAAACKPLDAMEQLDVQRAQSRL